VNLGGKVSDLLVSGIDLGPDGLDLLGDLNTFFGFVGILILEHLKFVLAAVDDAVLTLNLSLKVTFQNCNALLICLSSSMKVFDLSFQCGEVPLTELVGLNLSSVCCDDSLSDVLADLGDLILFLVLLLDLLVLNMFSLLSLLSVLFVVTECWSISGNVHWLWHWDRSWRVTNRWWHSWWRTRPNWGT
jgi:hypothetical protein